MSRGQYEVEWKKATGESINSLHEREVKEYLNSQFNPNDPNSPLTREEYERLWREAEGNK